MATTKVPASKVIDLELSQIGVREIPINNVKYNDWYYGRHVEGDDYPWCVVFQQWSFSEAGMPLPIRTASSGTLMGYAKRVGRWHTSDYQPGDVFVMTTDAGKHTGMIFRAYTNGVDTIEGNWRNAVCQNYRTNEALLGAYRPEYAEEEDMTKAETEALIRAMVPDIVKTILAQQEEKRSTAAPGDWSREDREWAIENGIIVGDPTGMHWRDYVTREQEAAISHRVEQLIIDKIGG